MKTFADAEGRHWNVRVTFGTLERVKTACDVDLADLATTQECLRKLSDIYTLGRVLYVVCEDQARQRNVTPEQFSDGFTADVLHEASNALIEEMIFFCRKDVRPALEMAFRKAMQADQKAVETMQARIGSLEREMDAAIANLSTSIDCATNSPASSASTLENGPCAASSGPRRGRRKSAGTTPAAR